jgi:5-methylcytosine-specific restriction endonuclease McrA
MKPYHVMRKMAMKRDGHQCNHCGTSFNLTVHHIIPRREGGTDHLDNLQTLCDSCHQVAEVLIQARKIRKVLLEEWCAA